MVNFNLKMIFIIFIGCIILKEMHIFTYIKLFVDLKSHKKKKETDTIQIRCNCFAACWSRKLAPGGSVYKQLTESP